jgi:uncharacterized membrane protein YccC
LLIFFSTGSVPDNLTVYNPYTFINDYIAMVMGMLVCAAAGAIILPPNSRWLWSAPGAGPARQVVYAISGKAQGPGLEFREPHPRPAAPGLWPRGRPAAGAKPAALDVRGAGSRPRDHRVAQGTGNPAGAPGYAESQPWRQAIRVMGRALVRLFLQPSQSNWSAHWSRSTTRSAGCSHRRALRPHFDTSALRRVKSYLHFIRTSLLDPQSPLAGCRRQARRTCHAS